MRGARIAFLRAANNPEEARIVVTDMVTEARKKSVPRQVTQQLP
jgi:hypothetical protein